MGKKKRGPASGDNPPEASHPDFFSAPPEKIYDDATDEQRRAWVRFGIEVLMKMGEGSVSYETISEKNRIAIGSWAIGLQRATIKKTRAQGMVAS